MLLETFNVEALVQRDVFLGLLQLISNGVAFFICSGNILAVRDRFIDAQWLEKALVFFA